MFAVLAAVVIGAFVFLIPAGWGLDEQSHVSRAYQIGQGNLLPDLRDDGLTYGGLIPAALQDYQMLGHEWASGVDASRPYYERRDFRDLDTYREYASRTLGSSPSVSVDFTNAGASSPLAYLPAAAGFAVASAADLSAGAATILARLLNAIAYIGVTWIGLYVLRRLRAQWLFLVVALLPAALFQAAYVSADTLTNAAALTFIAVVFRAFLEPEWMSRRSPRVGLAALAAGLALVKPTVVLLALLVLFIPAWSSVTRRRAWLYKGAVVGAALALTVGVNLLTRPISGAIRFQRMAIADQIDPVRQLLAMLGDPLGALEVFFRSLSTDGTQWLNGVVGFFGYNAVFLGIPVIVTVVATLTVLALWSERVNLKRGVALLAAGVLLLVAIVGALYLTFTPVGAPLAEGVQGRYFIPVVLPLALGAAALIPIRVDMTERAARVLSSVVAGGSGVIAVATWSAYLL